jgi:anti-sigma regulatory factor (Ser/Thr protein kinase)
LILGDPSQLKQVVVNLILNAIDAMEQRPSKYLHLQVTANAQQAFLTISDSGHGIPQELLSRVFDPFFTTKSLERGTGLGLTVCYTIIKHHGGELTVESQVGIGTTFRLTLPLAPRPAQADHLSPCPVPPPTGSGDPEPQPHPKYQPRVLAIDDESYITRMLQESLHRRLNCHVERVHDGQQALARLEHTPYALVVSDVRMPGIDGFGILDWISRFRPELRQRFLFITG